MHMCMVVYIVTRCMVVCVDMGMLYTWMYTVFNVCLHVVCMVVYMSITWILDTWLVYSMYGYVGCRHKPGHTLHTATQDLDILFQGARMGGLDRSWNIFYYPEVITSKGTGGPKHEQGETV